MTRELIEIHTFATHRDAHADEIAAELLMLKFGGGVGLRFPERGVKMLEFGTDAEANSYAAGAAKRGERVAFFGIGSDKISQLRGCEVFNEHGRKGRKPGDCCAKRVAVRVRRANDPSVKWLIKEIVRADNEATQGLMEIGNIVKRRNRLDGNNRATFELASSIFEDVLAENRHVHSVCPDEFAASGHEFTVKGVKVAIVTSTAGPFMVKYLRGVRRTNVQVVRREGGNTAIFTSFSDLARYWQAEIAYGLVKMELAKQDDPPSEEETEAFAEEARKAALNDVRREMPGLPHWYLNNAFLNGSESQPDKNPTILDDGDLEYVITAALERCRRYEGMVVVRSLLRSRITRVLQLMEDKGEGGTAAFEGNLARIVRLLMCASLEVLQAIVKASGVERLAELGFGTSVAGALVWMLRHIAPARLAGAAAEEEFVTPPLEEGDEGAAPVADTEELPERDEDTEETAAEASEEEQAATFGGAAEAEG